MSASRVRHGTLSGYSVGGCREECCRGPKRAYQKRYRAQRPGRRPSDDTRLTVPAGPVREHIAMLRNAGVGWVVMEDVSGVENRTLRRIFDGERQRLHRKTADAIMRVSRYDARGSSPVPSHNARVVLERLERETGATRTALAAAIGTTRETMRWIRKGRDTTASVAKKVHDYGFLRLPPNMVPGNPW